MWGNILGAGVSGIMGLLGGQQTNAANAQQAQAQQAFQAAQAQHQAAFNREEADTNRGFNMTEAGKARDFQHWHTLRAQGLQEQWQNSAMAFNKAAQDQQEAFQLSQVNSAMDYNTKMSNTQWQRGVADMRAAGINPMLAYSQGGASAPTIQGMGGASAAGVSGSAPNTSGSQAAGGTPATRSAMTGAKATMQDIIRPAFANAIQGARIGQELRNLELQGDVLRDQALKYRAEAATEADRPELVRAQTGENIQRTLLQGRQTETERRRPDLVEAQTHSARAEAGRTDRLNARFDEVGDSIPGGIAHSLLQALRNLYQHIPARGPDGPPNAGE